SASLTTSRCSCWASPTSGSPGQPVGPGSPFHASRWVPARYRCSPASRAHRPPEQRVQELQLPAHSPRMCRVHSYREPTSMTAPRTCINSWNAPTSAARRSSPQTPHRFRNRRTNPNTSRTGMDSRVSHTELRTDIVVVGAGLGGIAAAIAAAERGARVVLTEEHPWIGGQLTSQAVPPDEHPWIEQFGATARYRRLREGIRD